jgi:cytochrome P450
MSQAIDMPSLADPEVTANPFPFYERVKAVAPVYRNPEIGIVMVLGYEELNEALLDTETYSAAYYADMINHMPRSEAVAEIMKDAYPAENLLPQADDPDHKFHRKLAEPFLNPRALRSQHDRISARVTEVLDSMPTGTPVDFVETVAAPLSVRVMCDFVGIPSEDQAIFTAGADAEVIFTGSVVDDTVAQQAARDYVRLQHYVADAIRTRMENPTEDPISYMAHAEPPEGTREMRFSEKIRWVCGLVIAGNETSSSLFSSMAYRLALDPALLQQIKSGDAAVINNFVEETLRYDPPVMCLYRVATKDATLGGVDIKAGEMLAMMFGVGNRDDNVFEAPGSFDVDRANAKRHLSFGKGIHVCVGAPLARLEAQLLATEIGRRYSKISFAESTPPPYSPVFMVRSLVGLNLIFE